MIHPFHYYSIFPGTWDVGIEIHSAPLQPPEPPVLSIHFSFQAAQKGLEQAIEAARVPDLLEALGVAEGHGRGAGM